jgi:hypothetical protein
MIVTDTCIAPDIQVPILEYVDPRTPGLACVRKAEVPPSCQTRPCLFYLAHRAIWVRGTFNVELTCAPANPGRSPPAP